MVLKSFVYPDDAFGSHLRGLLQPPGSFYWAQGAYSSGFLIGKEKSQRVPIMTSERVARVCGLHSVFYVSDSWEASFQLVKRLWPNSPIQNESSFYRKSAGWLVPLFQLPWRWGPFPSSYKPDVGSYGVLIGLGSPFSLHSPHGWRNWSFRFCDIDSLNSNSIRHPSLILPRL